MDTRERWREDFAPDHQVLIEALIEGTQRQAAKFTCQLCGARWYQCTEEGDILHAASLDLTYAAFKAHVLTCKPEKPLAHTGFD